jgi:hypothetical protein
MASFGNPHYMAASQQAIAADQVTYAEAVAAGGIAIHSHHYYCAACARDPLGQLKPLAGLGYRRHHQALASPRAVHDHIVGKDHIRRTDPLRLAMIVPNEREVNVIMPGIPLQRFRCPHCSLTDQAVPRPRYHRMDAVGVRAHMASPYHLAKVADGRYTRWVAAGQPAH